MEGSHGIIYQKDKRVGITYAYENESYWDAEAEGARHDVAKF
jgi:hypothetical protein